MVMNHALYLQKGLVLGPALIFGRTDADDSCQSPSHDLFADHIYVGQSEQHLPLALILGNAAITGLSMTKEGSLTFCVETGFMPAPDFGRG